MKIFLTGSTGFVGAGLLPRLAARADVSVALGARSDQDPSCMDTTVLEGSDVVIHVAGRAHVAHEPQEAALLAFRAVNTTATLGLARMAAAAAVRRFVFVSSVKVMGEATQRGDALDEQAPPHPVDPYAQSKHEAELGLREIAAATGMDVVIIRPPLVYGPGVKANFASLMRAVRRGLPLPLGAIDNRRSLVALDNLVDFIITCTEHPAAAHQTFLVSDDEDLSTPELVRRLAAAMQRPARLWPVPPRLLIGLASMLGRRPAAERLCGNLQVSITKARTLLGWSPPVTVEEGLRRTVASPESR